MARYTGPSCKQCRREGEKLFLKGARCLTEKCAFERRGYAPGQHGQTPRRRGVGYVTQLREKQKVKRIYGILEEQFRNYFDKADQKKGVTGENLLVALESRLDNLVYRLGLASSRKAGRQLVRHRHITVNGKVVDIPAYTVKPGQVISVREKSRDNEHILQALKSSSAEELSWLRLDKVKMEGELLEIPKRANIPTTVQEQMVVELYSK
ncbi:MAG: 30S ribosomal protein S4 [candidate division Zixibacteria bacterium RBG_16_40_9]|nr:MAG: 30S ribosomal protein S4 [candidate division Zixibacteria bacterium RBG_16_40_9]